MIRIIILAILLWFLLGVSFSISFYKKEPKVVEITVHNPYYFSTRLEVKCDHDYKKRRFRYHRFITVYGKHNTIIRMPNNMKRCQIWPKVQW